MKELEWLAYLERWQFWFAVRYNLGKVDTEEEDDAEYGDIMVEPRGWVP